MWSDEDSGLLGLNAAEDADQLCRLLLSARGWGRSTRHVEAVELLSRVQGTGELPLVFVTLLLCSCWRWDRVTSRLIAAIADSGVLDDCELDELAESFLSHELVIEYPLTWDSPQWLEVELGDGTGPTYTVSEDTPAHHRPSFEPPLRRWAARRALNADPARLQDLLGAAAAFEPRHRDALIHGLLDAADRLEDTQRRRLIRRGLQTASASVRRSALDRLCDLDGPETALRRARSDTNASVRKWRPQPSLTLLEA